MKIEELNMNTLILIQDSMFGKPQLYIVRHRVNDSEVLAINNKANIVRIVEDVFTDEKLDALFNSKHATVLAEDVKPYSAKNINLEDDYVKWLKKNFASNNRLVKYLRSQDNVDIYDLTAEKVQHLFKLKGLLATRDEPKK